MNTIDTITIHRITDTDADLSYLTDPSRYSDCAELEAATYEKQDRDRLKAYYAGEWYMLGIRAQARIIVRAYPDQPGGIIQTITSPGLWGIESDSDNSHLEQTAADELHELRTILNALNVDTITAWPASVRELKTKYE